MRQKGGGMRNVHISIIVVVACFILENVFVVPLVVAQKGGGGGGKGTVSVRGYSRQDGTYVQPHTRTAPDGDLTNNLSYRGNPTSSTPAPQGNSLVERATSECALWR